MDAIRRTALVAVALLAGALTACSDDESQAQGPRQLAGLQMHPLWGGVSTRAAARELDVAKRAGADVVRIDVGWSTLEERGKGRINSDYARRIDAFLRNARARRIKVIVTLHETPCWASAAPARLRQGCRGAWWERGVNRFPPRKARDFSDAAVYVARRWGDRIHALEIWNEPNVGAFMRGRDRVLNYSRLVRSSYKRIKRVKPRLTVLAGSMLRSDGVFLTELYERGKIAGDYDAISYHPYTGDPNLPEHPEGAEHSLIGGTQWLHDIMTAHGDEQGILWATEAGASSCSGHDDCVSEQEQANRVAAYVRVARQFPYVRSMVIYLLRDKDVPADDIEDGYGIVSNSLRVKPAFRTFRDAALEGR